MFKRIRNRLKSKSKTNDEKKVKDNKVEDVTNENNVAPRKFIIHIEQIFRSSNIYDMLLFLSLHLLTLLNTVFRIMPFASSHSQRFDAIDELQVSTFSDMNTSLMNPYSDPLQASMHYANVSEIFISCSKRLHH